MLDSEWINAYGEAKEMRFMNRWVAIVIMFGFATMGCTSIVDSWIGLQCDASHPCKGDLICDRGECAKDIPAPEVLPECSLDYHCSNPLGIPQVCYKEASACVRCLEDKDCAPNFCTGFPTFECVGCLNDSDCLEGQECNVASAFCLPSESSSASLIGESGR